MPERDNDEGFLLRWSRRKRQTEDEVAATQNATEVGAENLDARETITDEAASTDQTSEVDSDATDQVKAEQQSTSDQETVPPELADVDVDALDYESDFTRFLGEGVPEALKRRALRKLWRSNPILANVDGLNDYDDDFTDAALAVDVLKTVHRVGKGYFTDEEFAAKEAGDNIEPDEDDGEPEIAALQEDDVAVLDEAEQPEPLEQADLPTEENTGEDEEPPPTAV